MDWLLPYLPRFIAGYSILVVAVMSPGPAVALLLGIGATQGRGAALLTTLGIGLGSATLALGTSLGLGRLLLEAAWLTNVLRYVGAAYLAWLAWKAFRKAIDPPAVSIAAVRPQPPLKLFLTGYLLQVTNIKALVFWMAILTVGPAQSAPLPVLLVFAAGSTLISLTGHGLYAVLLSSTPVRAAYNKARRWIEGALGTFLAVMAVRMAVERR